MTEPHGSAEAREIAHSDRRPACRACGSPEVRPRWHVDGFAILCCRECRSLTTDIPMDPARAAAHYGPSYYAGGDYADYQSSESIAKRNFGRFSRRLRAIHPGGRMLELGAAYGYFMDVASEGWAVEGLDISPDVTQACARRVGGKVTCGDLLTVPLEAASFDWVVAWDTIEHVDAPRLYSRRIADILRPGGRIALTTGDVRSLAARMSGRRWRLMTPPSHLTFFSRDGMRRMLHDAGLVEIDISTTGYDRSVEFVVFRLLGSRRYRRLVARFPRWRAWLKATHFYVNLFDIMFVIARKPAA